MQKIGIIFVCNLSNLVLGTVYLFKLLKSITQKVTEKMDFRYGFIVENDTNWKKLFIRNLNQTLSNLNFIPHSISDYTTLA